MVLYSLVCEAEGLETRLGYYLTEQQRNLHCLLCVSKQLWACHRRLRLTSCQKPPAMQSCSSTMTTDLVLLVNAATTWVDKDVVIATFIPEECGEAPAKPLVPIGPRVEDNSEGKTAAGRTYTDLLKKRLRCRAPGILQHLSARPDRGVLYLLLWPGLSALQCAAKPSSFVPITTAHNLAFWHDILTA